MHCTYQSCEPKSKTQKKKIDIVHLFCGKKRSQTARLNNGEHAINHVNVPLRKCHFEPEVKTENRLGEKKHENPNNVSKIKEIAKQKEILFVL